MSKSLGNVVVAGRGHQEARRRHPAPALRLGRLHRRHLLLAEPDHAAARELSQDPQHLPLPARQPGGLRSRRATRVPIGRAAGARPLDPAPRPAAAGALARRLRRVRLPPRRAGPDQLLRRRSERALPRHRQGSSLHLGAATRRAGARRRPTLLADCSICSSALDGADPVVHRRRDLVVRPGPAAPRRCSKPGCRAVDAALVDEALAATLGAPARRARRGHQGARGSAQAGRHRPLARRARPARAERRAAAAARERARADLPALFIVSQVELARRAGRRRRTSRARRDLGVAGRAGARRQVRALLELQRSGRQRRRASRSSASAACRWCERHRARRGARSSPHERRTSSSSPGRRGDRRARPAHQVDTCATSCRCYDGDRRCIAGLLLTSSTPQPRRRLQPVRRRARRRSACRSSSPRPRWRSASSSTSSARCRPISGVLLFALAGVLGGALGNLIDRVAVRAGDRLPRSSTGTASTGRRSTSPTRSSAIGVTILVAHSIFGREADQAHAA